VKWYLILLRWVTLCRFSILTEYHYAYCHYAEFHHAKCRGANLIVQWQVSFYQMLLSWVTFVGFAILTEHHYADCHYNECRSAKCRGINLIRYRPCENVAEGEVWKDSNESDDRLKDTLNPVFLNIWIFVAEMREERGERRDRRRIGWGRKEKVTGK
jgi:hypothetical protein